MGDSGAFEVVSDHLHDEDTDVVDDDDDVNDINDVENDDDEDSNDDDGGLS